VPEAAIARGVGSVGHVGHLTRSVYGDGMKAHRPHLGKIRIVGPLDHEQQKAIERLPGWRW
jgi:hypothetical protein